MPYTVEVSSGYVRTSGYAKKLRRVINAVLNSIRKGKHPTIPKLDIDLGQANEEISKLNMMLLKVFQELGIEKTAVVRVRLPIEIHEDGHVEVSVLKDPSKIHLEIYQPVSALRIEDLIKRIVESKEYEKISEEEVAEYEKEEE